MAEVAALPAAAAPAMPPHDSTENKVRFLLDMADRLDREGEDLEHVNAREAALLLRRRTAGEDACGAEAQQLAIDCNHRGVRAFKSDRYDLAVALLEKALALTAGAGTPQRAGIPSEPTRRRLRAVTYNNLGCLEKRRADHARALTHLEEAAVLEKTADGLTPATAMNLCAVLTKLGRTAEALSAAEAAVRTLGVRRAAHTQEVRGGGGGGAAAEHTHMLVVALHNLGVAQEFSDSPEDARKAFTTFSQAAQVANEELGADHATTRSVEASMHRFRTVTAPQRGLTLGNSTVAAMPSIGHARPAAATAMAPRPFGSPVDAALLDSSDAAAAADRRPAPPAARPERRAAPRGGQPQPQAGKRRHKGGGGGGAPHGRPHPTPPSPPERRAQQQPLPAPPQVTPPSSRARAPPRRVAAEAPPPAAPPQPPAPPLNPDAARHAQRMLRKRNKDELRMQAEERQRKAARRIYEKEQRAKVRREQEVERKKREEMAKLMYDKMCAGLRADEIRRYRNAARTIQKVWRGVMARERLCREEAAAITIQAATRSHQCRVFQKRRRRQEAINQAQMRLQATNDRAARVIQRRARRMFAQKSLDRIKQAKLLRRWHSARIIQRGWFRYRRSIELELMRKEEQVRIAETVRSRQLHAGARKLQRWWREHMQCKRVQKAKADMDNQYVAALAIQRLYRGGQIRQGMRRRKMLSRAVGLEKRMEKAAPVLQRAVRCRLAHMEAGRRREAQVCRNRRRMLTRSAEVIQRAYRCYGARRRASSLLVVRGAAHANALTLQRVYRGYAGRKLSDARRAERRITPAVVIIQLAWRQALVRCRRRASLESHIREKRQRRADLARTRAAMTIQAFWRGQKGREAARVRAHEVFLRGLACCTIQRCVRVWLARVEAASVRRIVECVREQEKRDAEERRAAVIIQRNMRMKLSRMLLRRMSRARKCAMIVQGFFLRCRARERRLTLKRERDLRLRTRACTRVQRRVRKWLACRELQRLEAYYSGKRRAKLLAQKREEDAVVIQCAWRRRQARREAAGRRAVLAARTAPAVVIQRCWRVRRFRREIEAEVAVRTAEVARREAAALRVQSFWRMVVAQEYSQMLREDCEVEEDAAVHLQCWWRQIRSRAEAGTRRSAARARRQKAAAEAAAFERCLHLAQAAARSVLAQQLRARLAAASLRRQVGAQRAYVEAIQGGAATAIQRTYRGYSDRLYAKGLRRAHREEERAAAAKAARRGAAALVLQLFARRCAACGETRRRLAEKAARAKEASEAYEQNEKPEDLVRQLFWDMEASRGVAVIRETEARKRRRHEAAVRLQCMARCRHARRVRDGRRTLRRHGGAALVIQKAWTAKKTLLDGLRRGAADEAAARIQALHRGGVGRVRAARIREARVRQVQEDLAQEETTDRAVVVLQSFWRLVMAKRLAASMSREAQVEAAKHAMREGAVIVQRVYRGYAGRKVATKKKRAKVAEDRDSANRTVFHATVQTPSPPPSSFILSFSPPTPSLRNSVALSRAGLCTPQKRGTKLP